MGCDGEFDLRSDAAEVLCLSADCNAEEDFDTCCVPDGTCATYVCTNGTVLKRDADLILCETPDCSTTRDEDCCDQLDSCAVYECPFGWQIKYQPERIICPGLKCVENDRWTCCDKRAYCDTFVCPWKYSLKKAPELIMCQNHTCDVQDMFTCCHHNDFCPSYHCPDGWTHLHNAIDIVCDKGDNGEISCNETHPERCCDVEGRCSVFHCPELYVLRTDPHQIPCKMEVCDPDDDEARCCKHVSYCNAYDCSQHEGRTLKGHSEKIPCKDDICDDATCCATAGRCITLECPEGEAHKVGAEDMWCDDGTCDETSFADCCDSLSKCSTFHCPKGYRSKDNNQTLVCRGWKCVESDLLTCCDKLAECNTWDCIHEGMIPNSSRLLEHCNDTRCMEEDEWFCCMPGYTCDSMNCGGDDGLWVHLPDAKYIKCDGIECVDTDRRVCCGLRALCDTWHCAHSDGYIDRDLIPTTDQKYEELKKIWKNEHDEEAEDRLFLSEFQRPAIHCLGLECSVLDNEICCLPRAPCESYTCGELSGMALRPDEGLLCHNVTCEKEKDHDTCCEKRASCNLHTCPDGMIWKEDIDKKTSDRPFGRLCKLGVCVSGGHLDSKSVDDGLCCDAKGRCVDDEMKCPENWIFKENHEELFCEEKYCDHDSKGTDAMTCCDRRAKCETLTCPTGFKHIPFEEMWCKGKECRPLDIDWCCEKAELAEEQEEEGEGPEEVTCGDGTVKAKCSECGDSEDSCVGDDSGDCMIKGGKCDSKVATTTTVAVSGGEASEEEGETESYACHVHGFALPWTTLVHASLFNFVLRSAMGILLGVEY